VFVHSEHTGGDFAADIRQTKAIQQSLQHAIFAIGP
jgi:hypothetical protein